MSKKFETFDLAKPAMAQIEWQKHALVEVPAELKEKSDAQIFTVAKQAIYEMLTASVIMAVRARDLGLIHLEMEERYPNLTREDRYKKFREETGAPLRGFGDPTCDGHKALAKDWDFALALLADAIYEYSYTGLKQYIREAHGTSKPKKAPLPLAYLMAQEKVKASAKPEEVVNPFSLETEKEAAAAFDLGKAATIAALKAKNAPPAPVDDAAGPDALLAKAEAELTAALTAIPKKMKKADKSNSLALLEKIKQVLAKLEAELSK